MGLFGGSSKSSSVANTTNQDNRGVADAQANLATGGSTAVRDQATNQPVSISSGKYTTANVSIVNTDNGAVKSALEFADKNSQSSNATIKSALGVAEGIFNKSTAAVDKAYEEAKGGASALQNIAIGSVVAAVAVVYFITKGKNA